jgi:hypothetical protein
VGVGVLNRETANGNQILWMNNSSTKLVNVYLWSTSKGLKMIVTSTDRRGLKIEVGSKKCCKIQKTNNKVEYKQRDQSRVQCRKSVWSSESIETEIDRR